MAIEIESKIYIGHLEDPSTYLTQHGAILVKPRTYEYNIRYESPANDFVAQKIVLRLRKDDLARLTYKSPRIHQHEGISERLELETIVGDFETTNDILKALGFRPYMVYEKYRTTYHFEDIPNTELVLDEMPYGTFIEIEGEAISAVIHRLELEHLPRISESYAELFEKIRQRYNIEFTDLTFANFAELEIDTAIFK